MTNEQGFTAFHVMTQQLILIHAFVQYQQFRAIQKYVLFITKTKI